MGTLWQVPDAVTAEFMKSLYEHGHETVVESLRHIALQEINRARSNGEFLTPSIGHHLLLGVIGAFRFLAILRTRG